MFEFNVNMAEMHTIIDETVHALARTESFSLVSKAHIRSVSILLSPLSFRPLANHAAMKAYSH